MSISLLLSFCALAPAPQASLAAPTQSLAEARSGFRTELSEERSVGRPLEVPPPELFSLVDYDAPSGPTQAYLSRTPPRADGERLPAIVWITGGFPTARGGSYVWRPGPPDNEQSASVYRDEGIVMLFPTVRGTADNPGAQEMFLGEVDDVIAAARFVQSLEHVDPDRVYLGGHSTGATLALLVAESTDLFRAVFAFGPAARFDDYGDRGWPFDMNRPGESRLRSPLYFLGGIQSPTLVVEGSRGNVEDLELLRETNQNPRVGFVLLEGEDHFTPLAPVNQMLARRIAAGEDIDEVPAQAQLVRVVDDFRAGLREARDLERIAQARAAGIPSGEPVTLEFTFAIWSRDRLPEVRKSFAGFEPGERSDHVDGDGDAFARVRWRRTLELEPEAVFEASAAFEAACREAWVKDEGWSVVR